MYTYEINIAREARTPHAPARYLHFARVELGQVMEEYAHEQFEIFAAKFPMPEWNLTLAKSPLKSWTRLRTNDSNQK